MTYRQAVDILDQLRAGAEFSEKTVNTALTLTGDLEPIEWPMNKVPVICPISRTVKEEA